MSEISLQKLSYEIPSAECVNLKLNLINDENDKIKRDKILCKLRESIIGNYCKFISPFGQCPCIYVDWTASGRALTLIEDYIATSVLPLYGNTHTTTSITGRQSTCFRQEARQAIAQSVNAKITGDIEAASDMVLFSGNGTTCAVLRLVYALELHIPLPKEYEDDISYRPIVFTSPYEHHSNLLPWRESIADVVTIQYHPITGVCLKDLEEKLQLYHLRRFKIGAFSAASNATGILTEVDAVAVILHRAGALAFFDYASAAPYVKVDMNPETINTSRLSSLSSTDAADASSSFYSHHHPTSDYWDPALAYKDAIYFSGHKFLGGPGCPGVLVVKRRVMTSLTRSPAVPGGGTVLFVTEHQHRYVSSHEEREEAGTPHLLGDVKLGLVMHILQSIDKGWIEQEELRISKWAKSQFQSHPNIILLGQYNPPTHPGTGAEGPGGRHLPLFSFLIKNGNKVFHYNFICALLNDLFGIQTRGGCQCAGPFSHHLLGIGEAASAAYQSILMDKLELYRPGYSRLSLPYWMTEEEMVYVIDAVKFIADYGYLFLKLYRCNPKTGEWGHHTRFGKFPHRKWLASLDIMSTSIDPEDRIGSNEALLSPVEALPSDPPSDFGGLSHSELLVATRSRAEGLATQLLHEAEAESLQPPVDEAVATEIGAENVVVQGELKWFLDKDDVPMQCDKTSKNLLGPLQPDKWNQRLRNGYYDSQEESYSTAVFTEVQCSVKTCCSSKDKDLQAPRYITHTSDREALEAALLADSDGATRFASRAPYVTPPDLASGTAKTEDTPKVSTSDQDPCNAATTAITVATSGKSQDEQPENVTKATNRLAISPFFFWFGSFRCCS